MAAPPSNERPLLAVDVDGVISLFDFEVPGQAPPTTKYHLIDGIPHFISMPAGPRLIRLAESFELIWATGWEDRANDHLPMILGVPELPHLTFAGRAQFGTAHWKLGTIDEHAGDRPLAWIDDSLDQSCFEWAERRQAPTLLVPTESSIGLEEGHVAALEAWARDGFSPR